MRKETPAIAKYFFVNRSSFRQEHASAYLLPNQHYSGFDGASTDFNIKSVLKAALGEHIERGGLYKNAGKIKKLKMTAFNLVKEEIVEVPTQNIIMCYFTPLLSENLKGIEDEFTDSSGVASHVNSFDAYNNSFLEFIERQSLIYTWLSKKQGKKIRKQDLSDNNLKTYHLCFQYINEIHLVNISITPDVYVVMILGFGNDVMCVSCSADWDLQRAVSSALKESFQYFKNKPNKFRKVVKKSYELEIKSQDRYIAEDDPHYYSKHLMDNFTPRKLKIAYKFIVESKDYQNKTYKSKCIPSSSRELSAKIKRIGIQLGINVNVCYIPMTIKNIPTKIIKIYSEDGFPHLKTDRIDPNQVKLSNNLKTRHFPNKGTMIPFP
ncbi:YcaO-like family protein [Shouchella miscanthi]|uniref:YcaO-like family protein n=1 Tax=Shouchella miscanthi TaxID=2598861 RepID=A0ABU6NQE7_9BACI|nr:YcaO-like family protein [Shouchella miscanthi]